MSFFTSALDSASTGVGEDLDMGRHWKLASFVTGLWTLAAAMAVWASVIGEIRMMFWAILVTLVACMVTGWLVAISAACRALEEERLRLETLAQIMAEAAADPRVSKLPR